MQSNSRISQPAMSILLSIVVPTKLRPDWLPTTLGLIVAQTDRADVEVIVGDNLGPPEIARRC